MLFDRAGRQSSVFPLNRRQRSDTTHAKNALPKTLLNTSSSSLDGISVSIPSSARNCDHQKMRSFCQRLRLESRSIENSGSGRKIEKDAQTYLVMLDMVLLEHHCHRDSNGQVGDDRKQPIRLHSLERQVVRDLVHSKECILIGCAANHVGESEKEWREDGSVAQIVRSRELENGDEEDNVFRERLVTHQLGDLRRRDMRGRTQ